MRSHRIVCPSYNVVHVNWGTTDCVDASQAYEQERKEEIYRQDRTERSGVNRTSALLVYDVSVVSTLLSQPSVCPCLGFQHCLMLFPRGWEQIVSSQRGMVGVFLCSIVFCKMVPKTSHHAAVLFEMSHSGTEYLVVKLPLNQWHHNHGVLWLSESTIGHQRHVKLNIIIMSLLFFSTEGSLSWTLSWSITFTHEEVVDACMS